MKKNKAFAIFCLLLIIAIVFVSCSSVNLSKKEIVKDTIILAENKDYGLTREQLAQELSKLKETPTYNELVQIASKKYGMSESVFQVVFGWAVGEGYDKNDTYLGYLCANVGINHYMGLGKTTADSLASSIAGYDHSGYYSVDRMQGRAITARDNPSFYVAVYKDMYLALKYPEERAHDCDGVSDYSRYGGTKLYSGRDGRYTINVWTVWYDGFKHWNADGKYTDDLKVTYSGAKEETHVTLGDLIKRINANDLCASDGFRTGSRIAGIIILVAKWLAPMILIILGMTDFCKAIVSNEEDSLKKAAIIFIRRMVIAIIIPFIPGLLYYLIDCFTEGDSTQENFVSCTDCLRKPFSCNKE